jgi:hypothetical protein
LHIFNENQPKIQIKQFIRIDFILIERYADFQRMARSQEKNMKFIVVLHTDDGQRYGATVPPDGHPKLLHLWPPKLPQAGRLNYQLFGLAGSDFLSW